MADKRPKGLALLIGSNDDDKDGFPESDSSKEEAQLAACGNILKAIAAEDQDGLRMALNDFIEA